MSEKKKKCYFCKKVLKAKIYYTELHENKITLCSMCKFIYHTLNEEYVNRGLRIVDRIMASIKNDKRHCINCRNLNENNEGYCFRDMWTGIGSHQTEYPNSFANHGCSNFIPRR